MGQRVFDAAEETNCLIRQCCGPKRPFTIHVKNNFGQEVLLVKREMKLCVLCNENCECCGRCCQDEVKIYNGQQELLGSMRRNFAPCYPRFTLYDPSENPTLILQGPCCCAFGCEQCCVVKFERPFTLHIKNNFGQILTTDKNQVGEISKQFSGLLKELFTDADNFGIKFPLDMQVDLKANLLGSVFLIPLLLRNLGALAGLEYLMHVDQLIVKQAVEVIEVVLPYESANTYNVFNNMAQKVFQASEESGCLVRQFCGPKRPFKMHVRNVAGQEVLTVDRPMKLFVLCCEGCECVGPGCQDEVTVTITSTSEKIGTLRRK
ncbi:hypothetical protein BaRGS_00025632 [Batillaria attramentaria]|uniref:Phospholipid scramblase n=1 Tax=Batillaria attramentaria TaxID=370345 RepID=A0ABD0K7V5_9CAEN